MRIVLNKYNINLYSTGTKNKAFFVERFNYTLGNKFKPIQGKLHKGYFRIYFVRNQKY
jgi:hypothetical protein